MRRVLSTASSALMLILLAALCSSFVNADDWTHPVGIFIIHRHGARETVPPSNISNICGEQCGQLSLAGAKMHFSLGQTLRAEYRNFPFFDPTSLPIRDTWYNPQKLISHSTPVDRTIQSAASMLRGLNSAPNSNFSTPTSHAILPVIQTRSLQGSKDLMPSEAWPNLMILSALGLNTDKDAKLAAYCNAHFTLDDSLMFGRTLGLQGACDGTAANLVACIFGAQDLIACNNANGKFVDPSAQAQFPKLNGLLELHNQLYFFSHNTSNPFDVATGTKGYQLATEIITDMTNILTGNAPDGLPSPPPFVEYSGHDITVMPYSETIGNNSLTNPLFAGTFITELHVVDRTTNGNTTKVPWVRIRYGEPEQAYATDHAFHLFYVGMTCINATTQEKYQAAPETGCSLAEWSAYIDTRGPGSDAGSCFLEPSVLQSFDCLPGNSSTDAAGKPPGAACAYYRTQCPLWACMPPGASADTMPDYFLTPNYICHSVQAAVAKRSNKIHRH